jgi:micrococcal nuclease
VHSVSRSSDPTPFLLAVLGAILTVVVVSAFAVSRFQGPLETIGSGKALPRAIGALKAPAAIDGDTFEATVPLWPDLSIHTRIRISGIDTPELRARCSQERVLAEQARNALQFLLEGPVELTNIRRDKYGGRFIASVRLADGSDLAMVMISAGYARAYDGGKRRGWC